MTGDDQANQELRVRLSEVESRPLADRAVDYAAIYDELRQRLEGTDGVGTETTA